MSENTEDKEPIYKNKKVMIGAASSSVLAFTSIVFGYIDSKIEAVNARVEDKYVSTREYVDAKHENVEDKLLKIENILIRIDDRVYQLSKQKGE